MGIWLRLGGEKKAKFKVQRAKWHCRNQIEAERRFDWDAVSFDPLTALRAGKLRTVSAVIGDFP
jgi:hypothetical protein